MAEAATSRREFMFEVGDHLFATDVSCVREVLEPMGATPIPGAVAGVLGLINVRGELVVAGDMSRLFELPSANPVEKALVVFEREGRRMALVVDRVLGLEGAADAEPDIDAELLEALEARDLIAGVGQRLERPYYRLDLSAVFDRVLGDAEASTEGPSTGGRQRK